MIDDSENKGMPDIDGEALNAAYKDVYQLYAELKRTPERRSSDLPKSARVTYRWMTEAFPAALAKQINTSLEKLRDKATEKAVTHDDECWRTAHWCIVTALGAGMDYDRIDFGNAVIEGYTKPLDIANPPFLDAIKSQSLDHVRENPEVLTHVMKYLGTVLRQRGIDPLEAVRYHTDTKKRCFSGERNDSD